MFKIQENGDGSTSIFCSQTGKLICTIKSQQRNMGLGCRPVNVVEPSPQSRSHSILDSNSECSSDDNKLDSRKRSISPIWEEVKEDFSDDCITPEEFARCINLVPTEKFKSVPLDELGESFPLRHLSRIKAFRSSEDPADIKISDDIPLTSSLGLKILDCNKTRNYYTPPTIEMKIKHYDSFCRFQLNTPTACSNFPKLRCREKKDYPVYFPQKSLKFSPCHTYAFNRRQRLEKMITFKTGLNARGRKLLLQCNKRLVISLKKLSTEETQRWLSKRSSFMRPITMDCIKDEEPLVFLSDSEATVIDENYVESIPFVNLESSDSDSSSLSDDDTDYCPTKISLHNKIVSFTGVLNKSSKCLPKNRNAQFPKLVKSRCKLKDCYIRLNDIINHISEHLGDYYVTGTNIRIPFLSNHVDTKMLMQRGTIRMSNSRYDHAYHRPYGSSKKFSNSHCLNNQSSKTKNNNKHTLKVNNCIKNNSKLHTKFNNLKDSKRSYVNNRKTKSKDIPVVDLTDSPPKSSVKGMKCVPAVKGSKWIFHCYGCGFENNYVSESAVKSSGTEHMKTFHCVSDPETFLCFSTSLSGGILEAFPGYKPHTRD